MNVVHCRTCGWVHFALSLAEVNAEIHTFNAFYETLDDEGRANYGGPSSIERYKKCFNCGGSYTAFGAGDGGKSLRGSTVQPILGAEWI